MDDGNAVFASGEVQQPGVPGASWGCCGDCGSGAGNQDQRCTQNRADHHEEDGRLCGKAFPCAGSCSGWVQFDPKRMHIKKYLKASIWLLYDMPRPPTPHPPPPCLCMMFEDMDLTGQTFSCLCMTFEDMDLTGLTFSCLCMTFEDMDLTGQNILKSFHVYISHLWSWTWWSKTFLCLWSAVFTFIFPLPVSYCGVGLNYRNAYCYDVRKVRYDFCYPMNFELALPPLQVGKTTKELRSRKQQSNRETLPLKDILLELMTKWVYFSSIL